MLNLPAEFAASNDTRREGTAVATLRTPDAVANLYIGFVFDSLPTFRNISKTRPGISFTLTPLQVSFHRAPDPDNPYAFDPNDNKYILIEVYASDVYHLKPKFHLARHDTTRSTCPAHAFWLCRASRTAPLDMLVSKRSTRGSCHVVWRRDKPSRIWGVTIN